MGGPQCLRSLLRRTIEIHQRLYREWPQLAREPLEWITFQRDYGPVPDLADLAWLVAEPSRLRMIGLQTSTGSVSLDVATLSPVGA